MDEKLRWLWCVVLMFHMTCFGWMLFRADSFQSVVSMIATMFRSDAFIVTPFASGALMLTAFYAVPVMLLDAFTSGERQLRRVTDANFFVQFVVYSYLFIMLLCFQAEKPGAFIYFQF
jgi:D-alanyl-lipoteichoic acid acyltransferase DltB (MBOAT superfamily)